MNYIDYKQLFILLILFNGLLCQMAARQCGVAFAAEFDDGQDAGCFCETESGPKCIMKSDSGLPLIKLIGNEVGIFGNAACSNVDGSTFVKKSGVSMAACQRVIGFCRPLQPAESNVDQVCCGGFSCNSCTQSYTKCSSCAGSHKLVGAGICEYDGSPTPNPPSKTPAPPITTTPKPTPMPSTITPTSKSNNPASTPQPSNGTPTPAPPTTKTTTASTNNNSQPPTPSSVSPTNADVSCFARIGCVSCVSTLYLGKKCGWCGGTCAEFDSATVACQAASVADCAATSAMSTVAMATPDASQQQPGNIDSSEQAFTDSIGFFILIAALLCCVCVVCIALIVCAMKKKSNKDDFYDEPDSKDVPNSWFFKDSQATGRNGDNDDSPIELTSDSNAANPLFDDTSLRAADAEDLQFNDDESRRIPGYSSSPLQSASQTKTPQGMYQAMPQKRNEYEAPTDRLDAAGVQYVQGFGGAAIESTTDDHYGDASRLNELNKELGL